MGKYSMRSPDEVKKILVAQWMSKAEDDLLATQLLLSEDMPLLNPACFHAQQAVEKFLKAYLTHVQREFPKTHSISTLLDLVASVDKKLADDLKEAEGLNPYAVESRYPGDAPQPSQEEARTALRLAQQARETILPTLKPG